MKIGVITDGISRDLEHALIVMSEFGLKYAELQFLWDKEVGDLNDNEMQRAKDLVDLYGVKVSCISRHNFAGLLVGDTEVGDDNYNKHMEALQRCIEMAKSFNTQLVRIMSFRKEMILFGYGGAEVWNVSRGAWDKLIRLLEPAVQQAEDEEVTLVVENGNNGTVSSAFLGHKLVDALGSQRLKILWDAGNGLYSNEPAYPDGYEALQGGYIGHIHLKDVRVDMPKATLEQCEFGTGQMAPFFEDIARSLKVDGYEGVVSLEASYRPEGKTFEDGFRASVGKFKEIFG